MKYAEWIPIKSFYFKNEYPAKWDFFFPKHTNSIQGFSPMGVWGFPTGFLWISQEILTKEDLEMKIEQPLDL